MNYKTIYNNLIEIAKTKTRKKSNDAYYENHHIVPRSLGGSDDSTNMVLLTAKEHYIAHHLLFLFETGVNKYKMANAWHLMMHINSYTKNNARNYEKAKLLMLPYLGLSGASPQKFIFTKESDIFIGTRFEFCREFGYNPNSLFKLITSGVETYQGWDANIIPDDSYNITVVNEYTSEVITGTSSYVSKNSTLSLLTLSQMVNKNIRSYDNWMLTKIDNKDFFAPKSRAYGTGNENPAFNDNTYNFMHDDGRVYTGYRRDFARIYSLIQTQVSALITGRQQECKGWFLVDNPKITLYEVTHPDSSTSTVRLLTVFCNKNKLCQRTMKAIAHKTHLSDRKNIPTKHKGFTIKIKKLGEL